ncbi:MAG TPA: ATP-binding cassette domain-containing protein [Candidatus Binatia bacterium]|nr:ATP-binding cassette domain-containing protein [Candidatus Binatia bacterium]
MTEPIAPAPVRTVNLTKTFVAGPSVVRAVDDVSLEIAGGELVLVMGPSGSGKTTLLSMIGGLLRPSSGRVEIEGADLTALAEREVADLRARRIGFVFQAFNLLANLTAEENVLFPALLVGTPMRSARARAGALLDRLGLGARRRFLPRDLSGGEKQRVAVARALVN